MPYDIGKDLGRAYADGYKQGVKDFAKHLIDQSKNGRERYWFLRNASEKPLSGGKVLIDTEFQTGAIIAKEFLDKAINAPAADVVEVVHGEWKEIDNVAIEHGMLTVKGRTWRCNVCGEARKTLTKPNMNYCPNCGAKMDAERKCEDG